MKLSTISRVFWYPLLIPFAVFMQCRKVNTTEISRLIVDDIAPAGGTGGTLVTITGEGFSLILTEDTVTFNNLPAQVIKATDTSMVVVVPQGGSTGRVTVTVRNNIAEGPVFTYQEENQLEIISIQPDGGYPFSSTLCKTTVITGKYFGEKNQDSKILLLENENQNEEDHMQAQIESWTNSEIKINFCGDYNGAGYSPMYLKIKQNGKQAGAYIIFQAELDQLGTYNVSTLTGDGSAGFADGMGAQAEFNNPSGMAVDSHGNIFVADELNNRIRKISPDGNVSTVAGGITNKSGSDIGNIDTIQLNRPRGIAIDSHDNIFITQYHVCHILKIDMAAKESGILAGSDTPGYSDGENTTAQFYYPFGLATDADDYIYVADEYNQRVRKVSPTGIVKTIAGDGTTDDLNFPKGVALNSLGEIFVIDSSQTSEILSDGRIYHLPLYIDHPQGVTIDPKDNLYVTGDSRIYCYYTLRDDKSNRKGVLTGNLPGYRDGDDASARFSNPYAITTDAGGNIYVADNGNARIRKIGLE